MRGFPVFLGMLTIAAPLMASAGEVDNRENTQQGRIGQGVASGQITPGGAQHLEQRESNINQSRENDLAANGGHLTPRESANLNARQNSVSNNIYNDKHNDIADPGVVPNGEK